MAKSSVKIHAPFTASHREIAVWGVHREDVGMAIKALVAEGLLEVLVSGRGHTCSRYRLRFADCWEVKFQEQRATRQARQTTQQKQREERRRARQSQPSEDDDDAANTANGTGDDDE